MKITFVLPPLGDSIEEATVVRWLKSPGEHVAKGEPVVEVSTDKVDTEVESPETGVLAEILLEEDDVARIGDVLARLTVDGLVPARAPDEHRSELPSEPSASDTSWTDVGLPNGDSVDAGPDEGTSTSRACASEAGSPIEETHPGATLTSSVSVSGSALRGTTQPLTRIRKTIASRMLQSLQTSAQLTTIVEVDVTSVGRARRVHNARLAPGSTGRLSYLPYIAVAALGALRDHPQINCSVDVAEGTITYPDAEHLGVAVDTDKGLFVPVIKNAGTMGVAQLAERIADIAERTRAGRVSVDELSGGTFTITNTGSRGALLDTPIINQPQVAILGVGAVARRPVVLGREDEGESIAIRSMVFLSLTYDHRVVDGADAARYLSDVKQRLESETPPPNQVPHPASNTATETAKEFS